MNLSDYRASALEKQRTTDLLGLMPQTGQMALDIGARDGHFSQLLAQNFQSVVALDLEKPRFEHPKVECVQGNAARLQYADGTFDFVFCAEVLEHIPPDLLPQVCHEIQRVCSGKVLIGVPYRQDIRVGRSTCQSCGGKNPPWGHVNHFDEKKLSALFSSCNVERMSFVGSRVEQTNALACWLMDWAGNPYGTYTQEEPCIHCGQALGAPPERSLGKKILTRMAFLAQRWTRLCTATRQLDSPAFVKKSTVSMVSIYLQSIHGSN
jgi:SAM-dependent methyltransferase